MGESGSSAGRGRRIRLTGVAAVFVFTIGAFASGVHTAGVEDMATQSVFAWIYYAAGLFVFGGLDLGVPAGGSTVGRAALWAAFFLAPAITTTAAIEAALRLIRNEKQDDPELSEHVVIVGADRIGLTYSQVVRQVEPSRKLLLVDTAAHTVSDEEVGLLGDVRLVRANLDRAAAFDLLGLQNAERMIVVTNDDLANLEIAWTSKSIAPELPVAVHVTDLTLLRPVNRLIKDQASGGDDGIAYPLVFNTHRITALHLYEHFLHPHFDRTGYRDVVVVGGFGRFAQTILELLRATAADELEHIVIVDEAASRHVRQFEADVPLDTISFSTVDRDLEDPGTWEEVESTLSAYAATPVYLLAGSDEVVNFRSAMLLRSRSEKIRIFARCFRRSAFAESLAKQRSFELLAFEDVLQQALLDHYQNLVAV